VFQGRFDRAAAIEITGSSLSDLSILMGHSLIQHISAGRYDLHPLVQEFATQKRDPAQDASLMRRHSSYYLNLLATMPREERANRLLPDFENVRQAWLRAVQAADAPLISTTVSQFGELISQVGLLSDGYALFQAAIEQFETNSANNELVARLLDQQWPFSRALYGLRTASALQNRLLTLTEDLELQVKTHVELANMYAEEGKWEQADFHFNQAEALAKKSTDRYVYINAIEGRIHINALNFRGDMAAGISRLQELLRLLDANEPQTTRADNMRYILRKGLCLVSVRYGDYALAIRTAKQNLGWTSSLVIQGKKVEALMDLALAEQFAGLFPEAIEHNQEALAIAEGIGAADDIGLLQANLCLIMRQSHDLETGLVYGQAAIELLEALRLEHLEGQARNRVGHTLLALARWEEAYRAYEDARGVWEPLQHSNRIEAVAGQAVAALELGKLEEAPALVDMAITLMQTERLQGIVEPVWLYLNLERALWGLGRREEGIAVLQQGQAWVEMIAERISDRIMRETFLQRPDNQRLVARLADVPLFPSPPRK
jgi:tetratricopeptide (TPR) repeat protein